MIFDQPMTIGITGPHGFVAGHVIRTLQSKPNLNVVAIPRSAFENEAELGNLVVPCDVVIHLAGMNRGDDSEVYRVNVSLAEKLVRAVEHIERPLRIVFSSSSQRDKDNPYGRSKKYAEEQFAAWAARGKGRTAINLVIPNVFGPGCRPHYNSVVATFCHQLAQNVEPNIVVDSEVEFIWINDLVKVICENCVVECKRAHEVLVPGTARLLVSELLIKLRHFHECQKQRNLVPDLSDPLDSALYATYLSHVELEEHIHRPQIHCDERGSLFEIIRMLNGGQVFFSTTKPGVIRGNHFHTRKIEWFCVLKGEAAIRLRKVDESEIHEFQVSGDAPQFVSIPVLHTHQIENVGSEDLLTMFWSSEIYVPDDADTYFQKVA